MGQGRGDGVRVSGGTDAIYNNVALHSVGVVQARGADGGDTRNGSGSSRGSFEKVADLNCAGLGRLAVDEEVVAFSELNGTSGGLEFHKGSLSIGVLVGEHEDFAVFLRAHADLVANFEGVHAKRHAILQFDNSVGRKTGAAT